LSCLIFLIFATLVPELKWLKTWKFRENLFHQFWDISHFLCYLNSRIC